MDDYLDEPLKGKIGVIYCRRSTGSKAQKESSLGRQREICLEMARQLGIDTPYDVYAEQCNSSATALKFEQLKSDIASGKVNVDFLIVEKPDRLKRQYYDDRTRDLQPLHDAGVKLIWAIGGKSKTPQLLIAPQTDLGAKMVEVVESGKNAEYVADLADRLSHSMYQRAKKGDLTARHSFGWKIIRSYDASGHMTNKETLKDEEDAPIVVEMFDKFLETQTLTDLIPILKKSKRYPKKRCLACKERNQSIRGLAVEGTVEECEREIEDFETDTTTICGCTEFEEVEIQTPIVRSILRNAYHAGDYTYFKENKGKWRTRVNGRIVDVKTMESVNKKVERRTNINPTKSEVYIENHHVGIVDKSIFLRVQDILDRNKTDNNCKGPKAKGLYTGRVLCGTCGARMTYGATQGRARYCCDNSKRSNTKVSCPGGTKTIRSEDLEKIVLDGVFDALEKPEFWQSKLEELATLVKQRQIILDKSSSDEEVKELRSKIEQLDNLIDATDFTNQMQVIKSEKMIEQKIRLEESLSNLQKEENKFRDNPVLKILDKMKNGRRYEDLLTVFPQEQDWYLMGVLDNGKNLNSEEVFQDSDLSLFSVFYVVSRNENVVVSLEDCDLFAELVTGDYWSLICAGYLFSEYGLSSFQMSVLLAQSFKKWEPDTDNFVWDEFLEKVQLNYCSAQDADLYPLSKRIQLKNQKQVCCSARVTVSGRQWENKSEGENASVLPHRGSPSTTPTITIKVN